MAAGCEVRLRGVWPGLQGSKPNCKVRDLGCGAEAQLQGTRPSYGMQGLGCRARGLAAGLKA